MSTLGKAALVVSGGILASRLLGFVRDVVLAGLLGRGVEADLYNFAFAIPDYLFFLMAGGYLTITLVPILSRNLAEQGPEEANRSFTAVLKIVASLMAILTAVAWVFARPLTELVFPQVPAGQVSELVPLVRIVLPAQFFFVVGSLLMAVQYTHRRFVVPSLAPLVYNIGIIAGGLASALMGEPSPAGFIWGALVGAVVGNFSLQWWGARRVGARLVPGTGWRHPAVREYLVLALPLMIGQSAVALDEVFMRVFGQLAGPGDPAALNYARRINLVPVGVVAQAAGVAAFPFLAGLFAEGKVTEMAAAVARALRSSLVVAGLGAAGVVGLALPVVQVAYQRGEFLPGDTLVVAGLLTIYGLSVPVWAAHQIYTRAFYAQRRMWLPVGVGTAVTVVAIPAYIVSATSLGAPGVAWVSVGALVLYTLAMAAAWHRRHPGGGVVGATWRTVAAASPAGLAGWMVVRLLMGGEPAAGVRALTTLAVGAAVVIAVYWAVLALMRAPELDQLRRRR